MELRRIQDWYDAAGMTYTVPALQNFIVMITSVQALLRTVPWLENLKQGSIYGDSTDDYTIH